MSRCMISGIIQVKRINVRKHRLRSSPELSSTQLSATTVFVHCKYSTQNLYHAR